MSYLRMKRQFMSTAVASFALAGLAWSSGISYVLPSIWCCRTR